MGLPMCGAWLQLHPHVLEMVGWLPEDAPTYELEGVQREGRCLLQQHELGQHVNIVRELPATYPCEVWACWQREYLLGLVTLPDCPAVLHDEGCVLFDRHAGAQSWALRGPAQELLRLRWR